MKRFLALVALLALVVVGGLSYTAEDADAHCVMALCRVGQALDNLKSYTTQQCRKWNRPWAQLRCYRTSNGRASDPTRITGRYAHHFTGYSTYVYGTITGRNCQLVKMWTRVSRHDGRVTRTATEVKHPHPC
jgi:hypothetical protein